MDTWIRGRYHIRERIGVGATATVYRAFHRVLDRDVAVKVLHSMADRDVARFAREARAMSGIDHDNVVSVIDFGRADDGSFYLALELVEGRTLTEELRRNGPMAAARGIRLLMQICSGIGRAHQLGIIHRDLKPDNIILCDRDREHDFVKILDFGLARPLESTELLPSVTLHGECLGTPYYMAPEQWLGVPLDERVDIYALGIIAYEMFTGGVPFAGNIPEIMDHHRRTVPPPPSTVTRDGRIPPELDRVIAVALEKDPGRRFATAEAMHASLEAAYCACSGRSALTRHARAYSTRSARASEFDPTMLDTDTLDVIDAPTICTEVRRLLSARAHRLANLVEVLWRGAMPEGFSAVALRARSLERVLEQSGRALAGFVAQMEDRQQARRQVEAAARGAIVDLGLALAVELQIRQQRLDPTVEDEEEPTVPSVDQPWYVDITQMPAESDDLEAQVERAEQHLAELVAESAEQRVVARHQVLQMVGEFQRALHELLPMHERMAEALERATAREPAARALHSTFAEADASVAGHALALEAIIEPERPARSSGG